MRVFHIAGDQFRELEGLPEALPEGGFLWLGSARREFEVHSADVQAALAAFGPADLEHFVGLWDAPPTQAALHALVNRLKK